MSIEEAHYSELSYLVQLALSRAGGGGGGGVANVTATAPVTSTGGANPNVAFTINADGSVQIVGGLGVGVLATDAQHGLRGGGTQHALVVAAGAAGFMSGADKTKLDGLPGSLALAGNVIGPLGANRVVELSGDSINKIVALDSGATIEQTQGGTAAVPAVELPLVFQPRSTTDGITKAAWVLQYSSGKFINTFDEVLDLGYNVDNRVPAEPTARWTIESDYEYAPGSRLMEMHGQFSSQGGGAGVSARWLSASFDRATHVESVALNFRDGAAPGTGVISISELNTGAEQWEWRVNQVTIVPSNYTMVFNNGVNIIGGGGGSLAMSGGQATLQGNARAGIFGDVILLGKSDETDIGRIETTNSGGDSYSFLMAGVRSFFIAAQGIQVGAVRSFGGGVGVAGFSKATTNPTTNPAGFVEFADSVSGAAKIRDALGAESNVSGGFFTQAMADADQVVSAANSASKFYETTGATAIVRNLQILLPDVSGTAVLVRNSCAGGVANTITVKFATGAATGVILPNTAAWIIGTGAGARVIATMT